MRLPYQIISIPYRIINNEPEFCIMHRADCDVWQFISGGGENNEVPVEAAQRETFEEYGVNPTNITQLTCIAYIPIESISECARKNWDKNIYVIPEHSFAFETQTDPILSVEHDGFLWLSFDKARKLLKWDSNKVAAYELKCILKDKMKSMDRKQIARSFLGKEVNIKIDRPIGYVHKKPSFSLTYPVNYGYIPGVIGGDGEEMDVYLLGVDKPVTEYTAKIIGIIYRENDVEDKLVAVPDGYEITKEEIAQAVDFQEKFFKTHIEVLK